MSSATWPRFFAAFSPFTTDHNTGAMSEEHPFSSVAKTAPCRRRIPNAYDDDVFLTSRSQRVERP